MNGKKRIIKFNLSEISEEILCGIGIYKIINTVTGDFYIGSTERQFLERFKEHCRYYEMYKENTHRNEHPPLWDAYDKYGIESFKVEILEVLNDKSHYEILEREEYYIQTLNPVYNVCKFPTVSGKPNLGRKLSEEWKQKIGEKSKLYKHSEETLKKVTENNKKGAVKLKFYNETEELYFNSWVEAAKHFNIKSHSAMHVALKKNKPYKGYIIEKLSEQKKKIKIFIENDILIFNSFNECDKHFNMWRGYTSELTHKINKPKFLDKYEYEII